MKFTEVFKYGIMQALLAAATPKFTLYQPGKASLRNHEYPRDVRWVVDRMVLICPIPPRATYMVQNTCNIYCTNSQNLSIITKIVVKTYIELNVRARNQKFFRTGEFSWNKGTSINISSTTRKIEAPHGKLSDFLLLDIPNVAFEMTNLSHR